MLQFVLVLIIGYFLFKIFYKYIMPVLKLLVIIFLSLFALQSETLVGYIFVMVACLYYLVSIVRWFRKITKDKDGNYVINY